MHIDDGLSPDPLNEGFVLGWGVIRYTTWHLAGVFSTKEKAQNEAAVLGDEYEVHFGSHRIGSDDFVWGSVS